MVLSPSTSSVEKLGNVSANSPEKSKHGGLWPDEIPEETQGRDTDIEMKDSEPPAPGPVPFTSMFRYVAKPKKILLRATRFLTVI